MKRPMLALIAHDSQKNALTQLAAEENTSSAMSISLPPRPPEKPSQGLDYISRLAPFRAGIAAATSRSRQGLLKARSMALSFFKIS